MNTRSATIPMLAMALVLGVADVPAADWWTESGTGSNLDRRVMSDDSHDAYRINWVDEYIEVMAGATVDNRRAVNQAHAVSMAKKTARHLAYEKLAETISGIRLTSDARYDRELMLDSNVKTQVQAMIRGAMVVSEKISNYPDGSVWAEVVLGVHLNGDSGVGGTTSSWVLSREDRTRYDDAAPLPAPAPATAPIPAPVPDPVSEAIPAPAAEPSAAPAVPPARPVTPATVPAFRAKHTGVIVDGRGLGAIPAVFPRVVTESGAVVYGPALLDERTLARKGTVGFALDPESAKSLERAGKNPLVIRALAAAGEARSDLVVSDDAASLIHATIREKDLLKRAAVVFVLD